MMRIRSFPAWVSAWTYVHSDPGFHAAQRAVPLAFTPRLHLKLFFTLVIFLFLLPTFATVAIDGLRSSKKEYQPAALDSLRVPGGGPQKHVRVEGYLLRLGSPDFVRDGDDYLFPFVDEETAERAVAEGRYTHTGSGLPVVASVRAEQLPVEAFARPPAGASEPVAIPYVLEGSRRMKTIEKPSRLVRASGLAVPGEVVLVKGPFTAISRPTGVLFAVLSLGLLILGVRSFRSWRRQRRENKERFDRWMEQREANARLKAKAQAGNAAAAAPGRSTPRRPGRSWSFPWGKVAGVFIVLGIVGARLGKSVAPAADNVARGVARSSDEAAAALRGGSDVAADAPVAAGRNVELPSAGDVALEAAGQIPNVKTGLDVRSTLDKEKAGGAEPSEQSRRSGSRRMDATITILDSTEVFERIGAAETSITCELTRTVSNQRIEGKVLGNPRVRQEEKSRELPDTDRGEFTRIRLEASGTGVRLTQVMGMAMKDGYVEVMEAAGDLRFVGGGSWATLVAGNEPLLLEFTDEGTESYARSLEAVIARRLVDGLARNGLPELEVMARYQQPPIQDLSFADGKWTLRQRGRSILKVRGR